MLHGTFTETYTHHVTRNTVEPRSTDTRLIRTPALYGQFRLSRQKAHIFSLKLTRFIRTPVNTDNGHFSVSCVPSSQNLPECPGVRPERPKR